MPAVLLPVSLSSSLAFKQMVTLQLLNQNEQDKGQNSNDEEEEEEEEQPQTPSREHSVSASSGPPPAPLSRESPESPLVSSEQAVQEAAPLPPQALPVPQDEVQGREGEPAEAEVLSEMKDDSFPPELACIPSQRPLGPPTSIPPKPPGPVLVDSEGEETLAASPLENACVGEPESSTGLSLTSHSTNEDPLALGPGSLGEEPQPPELKKDEGVPNCTAPPKELENTGAGSLTVGAAGGPNNCSQRPRYVFLSGVPWTRQLGVEVVAGFSRAGNSSSEKDCLIHSFIHSCIYSGTSAK